MKFKVSEIFVAKNELFHLSRIVKSYYLSYFIFLITGFVINAMYTPKVIFFWVNNKNSTFLDMIMPWLTNIGNGWFCIALCILLLALANIKLGLAMISTYALEGIAVQVLKQLIFTSRLRPWAEYADKYSIHLAPGFTPYSNNSFPSGHTATVFCMTALVIMVYPQIRNSWQFVLFLVSLAVAYSRIYLSQHYFMDVYIGSIVGILSSCLIYYLFYSLKGLSSKKYLWLNKTLLELGKK